MLPGNVRIFAPPDDKATTLLQFSAAGLASASVLFVVGACGCKLVSSQKSESSGRLGVQGPPAHLSSGTALCLHTLRTWRESATPGRGQQAATRWGFDGSCVRTEPFGRLVRSPTAL